MKRTPILLLALLAACNSGEEILRTRTQEPAARIVEYTPAPGQFINEPASGFDGVETPAAACAYAESRLSRGEYVSLGGWGGYIVAQFERPVPAADDCELYVKGNQLSTSSEPGVVWVAADTDGDGDWRDEQWYELRGSEYASAATRHDYRIVYTRPDGDNQPVAWHDAEDGSGTIERMPEHRQPSYFPAWIDAPQLEFSGVRLPDNVSIEHLQWVARPFAWGYADNYTTTDCTGATARFRIANAVLPGGEGIPARLAQVDFIKVQTGVNCQAGVLGEISTEVCGIGCFRIVTSE